ncbi:TonB-dependent receptor [Sphingosinicellaceae bacterium]|nr:TonB-dependent receptor [Sphingosinicellaceae bacterium]
MAEAKLSAALTDLAKQSAIDILFSEALIGARSSRALNGRMSVETALTTLLAGSNLGFHRTGDGAFVINAIADTPVPQLPDPVDTIPEILVVGHRAQNGDIRRSEDDIQPYQVSTRREIEDSHSGSIQEFTRSRLPANAQIASPAQDFSTGFGTTRSEINLRGLGTAQMLVLVDGRRMPSLPGIPYAFNQPDINGIPIDAIDRIETLTATAGGIYGPGATSGVVNLILRRNYRGADATLTTGLTTRGDAPEVRLQTRLGFTPDHGQTDIMFAFSKSDGGTLRYGDRDYIERAAKRQYANDPSTLLASLPGGAGINVFGADNLVLDQRFGGAALGSSITSLPLGLGGNTDQRNALLLANAGRIDLRLSDGLGGKRDQIVSRPRRQGILFNARHRFGGSGIEAIVDVIDTRDNGRFDGRPQGVTDFIAADSPTNPFQQDIHLSFPQSSVAATQATDIHVLRYTGGLIAALPRQWRANLEYTGGFARQTSRTARNSSGDYRYLAYSYGTPVAGRATLDPLGDWGAFVAALNSYGRTERSFSRQVSRLNDGTLRLAGPLLDLPGGPATLSLSAEQRREHTAASTYTLADTGTSRLSINLPRIIQRTGSLLGELRLPISGAGGLLRNLEVQLALRRDTVKTTLPATITLVSLDAPPIENRNTALAYTVGGKFRPIDDLMLRASVSTGILPPSVAQIGSTTLRRSGGEPDPKRGGQPIGGGSDYQYVFGGAETLRPEHARSLSAGIVVTPFGDDGLRASADFTRIDKRGEIGRLPGVSVLGLLADESLYPGRIERAPLTAADQALGFTGGRVTRVDLTTGNIARSRIDALDLNIDYPLMTKHGTFRVYANATWEPRYWQQSGPGQPHLERVGYSDGPLEWRGNGGFDWSSGSLRLGLNGQYYAHYQVATAASPVRNAQLLAYQGSNFIPAQFYVDFSGAYEFADGWRGYVPRGTQLRLGIVNLLDHRPPTVTDPNTTGYSYYGDPRRRRIELTIAVPFGS